MEPSFLHTFTAFCLGFQGLGLPKGLENIDKQTSGNDNFRDAQKLFLTKNDQKSSPSPPQATVKPTKIT